MNALKTFLYHAGTMRIVAEGGMIRKSREDNDVPLVCPLNIRRRIEDKQRP